MKIFIATGIYPPDMGGPANYVRELMSELQDRGHTVRVKSFKFEKKLPTGFRHLLYFLRAIPSVFWSEKVILMDTFSAGFPAYVLTCIFRRPVVLRTGGDFVWERYIERTGKRILLRNFYSPLPNDFTLKERITLSLIGRMLRGVDKVIFSTAFQRDLTVPAYNIESQKALVIENYLGTGRPSVDVTKKVFLWSGRDMKLKNVEALKQAFVLAKKQCPDIGLEIVRGVPRDELLDKISKSYAVINPSVTEISPNFILESIMLGKPFISSREIGFFDRIKECGVFCDPLSVESIAEAIVQLTDGEEYAKRVDLVRRCSWQHSYADIAHEFEIVLNSLGERVGTAKKVLFMGMTDYVLEKDNADLTKKFEGLAQQFHVVVLARGKGWGVGIYNSRFYLIPRLLGKVGLPLWLLADFFAGLYIVFKEKPTTIIAQSPSFDGVVALMVARLTRREFIVEVHADWVNAPFYYFSIPFKSIVKRILKWCGKVTLSSADKVRVVSDFTESIIQPYRSKRSVYSFAAFSNLDIFSKDPGDMYGPTFMYIGALYPLKGVHDLIQAFQRIHAEHPELKLCIAGKGPYEPDLRKLTSKSPGGIEFIGHVSHEVLSKRLNESSVCVLPSRTEGLPRVLIEGAMSARALVGSRVGGIPDLIEDGVNGYLFESGNVDELEEILLRYVDDPDLARRQGGEGRKMMLTRFSIQKFLDSYKEMVYDNPAKL